MLHERAMICDLTLTSYTGTRTSKKDTQELLEAKSAQRGAASVVIKLISKESLAPINSVTTKIRSVHKMLTAPWSHGEDILPNSLFLEYNNVINDAFLERDAAVDEFCKLYPILEGAARNALGDLDFERLWAPVEEVRAAFTHRVRFRPIPQGSDFRSDLDEHDLERIKAQLDADVRQQFENSMSAVRNRVISTLQELIEKLERYREGTDEYGNTTVTHAFRDSLFDATRSLIAILPHFNISNDPALAQAIAAMTQISSSYTPETLRNRKQARSEVVQAASGVINALS
jgi:hypothetical protein